MILENDLHAIVATHILQFSIAISLVAVMIWMTGRRWPHFTFLICMLAMAKCLVPPLITSPAGIFTRTPTLAFAPRLAEFQGDEIVRLKQRDAEASHDSRPALDVGSSVDYSRFDIRSLSFPMLVMLSWLVGMTAILARASWQWTWLLQLIRKSRVAPEDIQAMAMELRGRLGLARPIRVLVTDENFGPACVGFLRPTLILPDRLACAWPDRLLRPIVAHELIHARRGDIFWGYMQFAAQVIWWFHPLVWWLGKRANLLCERCCDDEVVSSLKCDAADYGESLVRVLELKNATLPVPLCHAMSPKEITGQRLERLLSRRGRYSKRASMASWVIAGIFAVLVIPGMHWAHANEEEAQVDEQHFRMQINHAIQVGDWETAIGLLRPLVDRDPENGGANFFLGYALHAHGDLDEAVVYHRRATDFPKFRPNALYNWGCALALQGQTSQALAKLSAAIDAGFANETRLIDDPDLKSLIELEEFNKLQLRANKQREQLSERRQFRFWMGQWCVTDESGDLVGNCTITENENGHVMIEKWTDAYGDSAMSVNYFHPAQARWKQTRVDELGGVIEYSGKFVDGRMDFSGSFCDVVGKQVASHMTITPLPDGTVEQVIEHSTDDGQTWNTELRNIFHLQERNERRGAMLIYLQVR